ncbi:helix-turn-helix domain-containing protein [Geodermatophilus sp. SYSU D00965]
MGASGKVVLCVPEARTARPSRNQHHRRGFEARPQPRRPSTCSPSSTPARSLKRHGDDVSELDLPGTLRRIRRQADLSQRELAAACGVSASVISHAEAGRRGLPTELLVRAAALAGLRLALVDEHGREVPGMDPGAVRDKSGRLYPAHLDTRYSDEGWWHDEHRYSRERVWYTFDRDRRRRDAVRRHTGTPDDHQLPRAGDAPSARAEAGRLARWQAREAERRRRFEAGELSRIDVRFDCTCPPRCDELDDGTGSPVHAPDCPCGCDLA